MSAFPASFTQLPLTTEVHDALIKNGFHSLKEYVEECEKYVFRYPDHTIHNVTDPDLMKNMIKSAKETGYIFITGLVSEHSDGETRENKHFIWFLKRFVYDVLLHLRDVKKEIHVVVLSQKDGKGLHPKILRGLIDGKWKLALGGGVAAPGFPRPNLTITVGLPESDGYRKKTIHVNGGLFGNMQKFEKPVTPLELGCPGLIELVLSMPISSKEFMIHFLKGAAAALFPNLRKEGVSEEECLQKFKDFCNPGLTCKEQKEFGRKACLSDEYFPLTSNLSKMVKAFVDLLQALLDPEFYDFLLNILVLDFKVEENAIQGRLGDIFSGFIHDTTWGSGGGAQICIPAHALSDGSKPKGIFGMGTDLVFGAMRGDSEALEFLGLPVAIDKNNLRESCGIIFNKIWEGLVDANSKAPAAKAKAQAEAEAKAQAEAKAKAQAEAEAKAQDEAMTEAGAA